MNNFFRRFAAKSADALGSGWAFMAAIMVIVVWAVTGPIFHFSDTWQLIINTATNLITFLMVFMIQNTQSRDAKAIHIKLDELIRAVHGARNSLVSIEGLSDEELETLNKQFQRISKYYAQVKPEEQVVVAAIVDEEEAMPTPAESQAAADESVDITDIPPSSNGGLPKSNMDQPAKFL